MVPLIKECRQRPEQWQVRICLTGQHREMLEQVMTFFGESADADLSLMKPGQTLFDITSEGLKGMDKVLSEETPDVVVVQGDTTSAFTGALAAFYKQVPVAHIEAGLRSGNKYSPFPEEVNRQLTGVLAEYHFAPTLTARENLHRENIHRHVYVTGNTVIDALLLTRSILEKNEAPYRARFDFLDPEKRTMLVTAHRRESFGAPFEDICHAVRTVALQYADSLQVVFPVHLNPRVQEPVERILKGIPNVHLIAPLEYAHLVWIMKESYLVVTDSGGIQEEAPSLGKPVLVLREVTERTEGIAAGTAILVGTDKNNIIRHVSELLENGDTYQRMANAVNPYGDGTSAAKIIDILTNALP